MAILTIQVEDNSVMAGLKKVLESMNGVVRGREEGRESRNIEIAKMMISEKEPIEKIMAYTGLSEKEIQSLN